MPAHLRSTGYRGATDLGHGEGYLYPHDLAEGWVPQEYRPPEVADRVYYEPSPHGREQAVSEAMSRRRSTRSGTPDRDNPSGDGDLAAGIEGES